MANTKGGNKNNCGMYEMPSGLLINADSLAGGPKGTYVNHFPSPDPETSPCHASGDPGYTKDPKLSTKFLSGRGSKGQ